MWCFFDESWPDGHDGKKIGVLFAVLVREETLPHLERVLFSARSKYFGREHAKDRSKELKGQLLLSKSSFRVAKKISPAMPNNHAIVREIFHWCIRERESHPVQLLAATVYGVTSDLRAANPKQLELPFTELIWKVSAEAQAASRDVTLVFDQRTDAQTSFAIAMRNFLEGVNVPRVRPYPYFAVSNVVPAVQVADIGAYIIGRKAVGDADIEPFYRLMSQLRWTGMDRGKKRWGFQRYETTDGKQFRIRRRW